MEFLEKIVNCYSDECKATVSNSRPFDVPKGTRETPQEFPCPVTGLTVKIVVERDSVYNARSVKCTKLDCPNNRTLYDRHWEETHGKHDF
jgi:hypothetical protein